MKPDRSEKRPARGRVEQGRVELWTPWGIVRSTRAQEAARVPRNLPPVVASAKLKADCKPRA